MKQLIKVVEDTSKARKLTIDGIGCDSYSLDYQSHTQGGGVVLRVEFKSLPASFDIVKIYMALLTGDSYHLYSDGTWEHHGCVVDTYKVVLTKVVTSPDGAILTFQEV